MKRLILCLSLTACVHTPTAEHPFVAFPARFYSEQELTLKTPQETRQLKAQLQRGADRYDLVLIEPRLGLVLARAVMDEHGTRAEYLAPQIDPKTLPLQDIGHAIRQLYEAPAFAKDGSVYIFQAAESPYAYRLETIDGPATCPYPKSIALQFKEANYRLDIAVESFTCS